MDFPDDPEMRVSHETIYQSLFVQGRGELRRELVRCLRTGRTCRKQRGTTDGRCRIPGMVMISERPPEVDDRAVPGDWEGDIILGTNGRSAVGTLVERTTRFVMLLHLEGGRAATSVEVGYDLDEALTLLGALEDARDAWSRDHPISRRPPAVERRRTPGHITTAAENAIRGDRE